MRISEFKNMVENKKEYKNYQNATKFDWSDVKPVPQYDGKETILRINYTPECTDKKRKNLKNNFVRLQ